MMRNLFVGTFGAKIFSSFLGFLIIILTARLLGPEGRGTISLIITAIAMIVLLSNVIGGSTLVYLVPRGDLMQLLVPSFIWTLLINGLVFVFLKFVNIIPGQFIIHIFFLSVLNSLIQNNLAILMGKENIKAANILSVLQAILHFGILVFLFFIAEQLVVMSYVRALYSAYILIFIISSVRISGYISRFSLENCFLSVGMMFRYGFMAQLANVIQFFNYRLGYFILDSYAGRSQLGIYSVSVALSEAVWMFSSSIAMVQYSRIANSFNNEASYGLTLKLVKFSYAVTLLILLFLLLLPSALYVFIFGAGFESISKLLFYLTPGIFLFSITIILSAHFSGIGKYYISAIAAGIGFILAIFFNSLLIPKYGIEGAAIATTLSYFGNTFYLLLVFFNSPKFKWTDLLLRAEDIKFYLAEFRRLYLLG